MPLWLLITFVNYYQSGDKGFTQDTRTVFTASNWIGKGSVTERTELNKLKQQGFQNKTLVSPKSTWYKSFLKKSIKFKLSVTLNIHFNIIPLISKQKKVGRKQLSRTDHQKLND